MSDSAALAKMLSGEGEAFAEQDVTDVGSAAEEMMEAAVEEDEPGTPREKSPVAPPAGPTDTGGVGAVALGLALFAWTVLMLGVGFSLGKLL
jgi:hypothetical protein